MTEEHVWGCTDMWKGDCHLALVTSGPTDKDNTMPLTQSAG